MGSRGSSKIGPFLGLVAQYNCREEKPADHLISVVFTAQKVMMWKSFSTLLQSMTLPSYFPPPSLFNSREGLLHFTTAVAMSDHLFCLSVGR